MVSKVHSLSLLGLNTNLVEVELDYRHGLSSFSIVGLGDKAVQEAKERISSALRNSKAEFIPKKIVVNLAPADLPKAGPSFDLAIVAGFLLSSEQLDFNPEDKIFLGEVALDGSIRPIPGVLPLVAGAKQLGFKQIYIPKANATEAAVVGGVKIFAVDSINQLIGHFTSTPLPLFSHKTPLLSTDTKFVFDLKHVKGQLQARRALEIAAAGGHNVLMSGVPGSGKTLLAKCFSSILPVLDFDESLEVSKIHSVAGLLDKTKPVLKHRPFRSPHHSVSQVALVGGGAQPKPGEISLAHRGVLFLDEFTEFSNQALEALRQPLEDKIVTISRAAYSVNFPAEFTLIAAMNPCKCGHLGDPDKECHCSPAEIKRFQGKISGPLLDRFDLQVHVNKIDYKKLFAKQEAESSASVAQRVLAARRYQQQRKKQNSKLNSQMLHHEIEEVAQLQKDAEEFLHRATRELVLSARAYFRVLKVARTIADLKQQELISHENIAEALNYRKAS